MALGISSIRSFFKRAMSQMDNLGDSSTSPSFTRFRSLSTNSPAPATFNDRRSTSSVTKFEANKAGPTTYEVVDVSTVGRQEFLKTYSKPSSLAFDPKSRLTYVVDSVHERIVSYDDAFTEKTVVDYVYGPTLVVVTTESTLVVVHNHGRAISWFSLSGDLLHTDLLLADGDEISSVCALPDGGIAVIHRRKECVQIIGPEFRIIDIIIDRLSKPHSLAASSHFLYVCCATGSLEVFSLGHLEHLDTFCLPFEAFPKIAVSAQGLVAIADVKGQDLHLFQEFQESGSLSVHFLGSLFSSDGRSTLGALCFNEKGHLLSTKDGGTALKVYAVQRVEGKVF
eukprot:Colp12_sorted_trinity150504_noHs@34089